MTYYQVPTRNQIKIGSKVKVIQKIHYESGEITQGMVQGILTSRPTHPRGIKVRLTTGIVGRVLALDGQEVKEISNNSDLVTQEGEIGVGLTENDLV